MNDHISLCSRIGTAGGTLTIILANLHSSDLVKTAILAATGALVSFFVSFFLKKWFRKKDD